MCASELLKLVKRTVSDLASVLLFLNTSLPVNVSAPPCSILPRD